MDRALAREPSDAQALFERATIATVIGHYSEARADCQRFAGQVPELFGNACLCAVRGLTGEAADAAGELTRTLERARSPSASDQSFAQSLLGELWLRAGDAARGERSTNSATARSSRYYRLMHVSTAYCYGSLSPNSV